MRRTILSIIEHFIGALCGALQSAAVKGEIDCSPDEIAALRKALQAAAERWQSRTNGATLEPN